MLSRRRFLHGVGLAPIVAGAHARGVHAAPGTTTTLARTRGVYTDLGIRPLINAAGTYTALSASLMRPEVVAAMQDASDQHVSIAELQDAVGKRIAGWLGAEAALVTSGCAAALTLATAACICGKDEDRIHRVPDTTGMKNEVVMLKSHRFSYDHAVRNVGARIVEVESAEQLVAAINSQTAMLLYLNNAANSSPVSREDFSRIGRQAGVPTLIDAAADVPPVGNLTAYIKMGFDLAAYSGGKGLRGPQCSGMLVGRKDLIEAAFTNGSPRSDSAGRIGKVGKEEIVGLMTALDLYLKRDHQADWKEWEREVAAIAKEVDGIRGVKTEVFVPEIANAVPHLAITWDPAMSSLKTRDDFAKALREGEPRIEARPGTAADPRLEIAVWMMKPGEYETVAKRCKEILKGNVVSS